VENRKDRRHAPATTTPAIGRKPHSETDEVGFALTADNVGDLLAIGQKKREADGNDLTNPCLFCNNRYMATKRKQSRTITKALRDAINDSELSFAALGRETGVVRQSLMKFARGERSLRLDMADRLAKHFGLEVTKRKGK